MAIIARALVAESGGGGPAVAGVGSYSLAYPRFRQLRDQSSDVVSSVFGFAPLGVGDQTATFMVDNQTVGATPNVVRASRADAEQRACHIKIASVPAGSITPANSKSYNRGMMRVGEAAPALRVLDQEERERTLTDLSGPRGLVLLFYRGYW